MAKAPALPGVYALICPRTGDVRYVGRSKNIRARYNGHCASWRRPAYPVSQWVKSLKDDGLRPDIKVLQLHPNPEMVEPEWIEWARGKYTKMLNVLDGGADEGKYGKGESLKPWCVKGMQTPWQRWISTMFISSKMSAKVREEISKAKSYREKCNTEIELINFELAIAQHMYEVWPSCRDYVKRWAESAAPRINLAYPGRVTIQYMDGVEVTP